MLQKTAPAAAVRRPRPPGTSSAGRPQPRKVHNSGQDERDELQDILQSQGCTDEWKSILRGLLHTSAEARGPAEEATLTQCASLAVQLNVVALKLRSLSSGIGISEAELCCTLSQRIFAGVDASTLPSIPQDTEKALTRNPARKISGIPGESLVQHALMNSGVCIQIDDGTEGGNILTSKYSYHQETLAKMDKLSNKPRRSFALEDNSKGQLPELRSRMKRSMSWNPPAASGETEAPSLDIVYNGPRTQTFSGGMPQFGNPPSPKAAHGRVSPGIDADGKKQRIESASGPRRLSGATADLGLVEVPKFQAAMHRRKSLGGQPKLGSSTAVSVEGAGGLFYCKHTPTSPKEVYDLDIQLGAGTFGSVRKATHKTTGQTHAVKTCPKKLIPPEGLWAEIDIMKQLDHPHIMRLYGTFEDDQCVYIASELCDGGQLFDAIIEAGVLSEYVASRLFKQMMSAVSYIHFKFICHRDLKPENFLLSKKGDVKDVKVKLIDFGTAKRFDLAPLTTKVCTLHYVAPEVLRKSMDPYTEKVDVWSCGVILYVMLCGTPPFFHDDEVELMKLVKKGKWTFNPEQVWDNISQEAKDLTSSMLCVNVESRTSANEAIRQEWCNQSVSKSDVAIDEKTITQMRCFVAQNRLKKVALQIIAREVPDDTIEQLRNIFLSVDTDNSGTLTVEEMDAALLKMNTDESVRIEMRRLMAEIDEGGSGAIFYTEFIASTISKQTYMKEEVCRAAFHVFDMDGDGVISTEDLRKMLESIGDEGSGGISGVAVDEVNEIMAEVDVNGDGEMCFEEFMRFMNDKTGPSLASPVRRKVVKVSFEDG